MGRKLAHALRTRIFTFGGTCILHIILQLVDPLTWFCCKQDCHRSPYTLLTINPPLLSLLHIHPFSWVRVLRGIWIIRTLSLSMKTSLNISSSHISPFTDYRELTKALASVGGGIVQHMVVADLVTMAPSTYSLTFHSQFFS